MNGMFEMTSGNTPPRVRRPALPRTDDARVEGTPTGGALAAPVAARLEVVVAGWLTAPKGRPRSRSGRDGKGRRS